ncbi:MAG: T9SS type A sorting domain-containing protein [Calditrichia bacterium]
MDDGDNWEKITTSIFPPSYVSTLAGNDSVLFVGTEGFSIDVYKTTNNGNSFESLNVPGSGNITALQSKNGFVFAGRTTGVYRTSDNGENWVSVNSGFPSNVFIQDINSNNNFIYVSTINSGLFRSSSNGDDWEEIGGGIINDVAYSIETKNEQIFIGTRASGVFYSDDNGLTWMEFNERLFSGFSGTYPSVLSMIVKSDTVYCGLQNYGVWKSPIPTITNAAIDEFLPTEFSLSQNYPNPFNPVTTIQYNLPQKGEVVLKIYDMLGREIKTLVDRVQSSGKKSVIWDGTDQLGNLVSSGIYLYRLRSGEITDSKKMILMK